VTDPLTSAGAVAHSDQVAAELASWALLLGGYRSQLLGGGFREAEAFRFCEIWFSEQLCHGLSEPRTGDPSGA
jgi:hypothetical protein